MDGAYLDWSDTSVSFTSTNSNSQQFQATANAWNQAVADADADHAKNKRDDPPTQLPPDPDNGPGTGPTPATATNQMQQRGTCAIVGGAIGALSGGLVGGIGEGLAGAALGTAIEPGGGTLLLGAAGATDGLTNGAAAGGALGAATGAALCGNTAAPPNTVANTAHPDDTPNTQTTRGQLTGSLEGRTQAEKDYANEQLAVGHNVEVVPEGPGRIPDFKIDGKPVELKTLPGFRTKPQTVCPVLSPAASSTHVANLRTLLSTQEVSPV